MQSGENQASGSNPNRVVRWTAASGGRRWLLLAEVTGSPAQADLAVPYRHSQALGGELGRGAVQGPFHFQWSSESTTLSAPAEQSTSARRPVQRAGGSGSGTDPSAWEVFHRPPTMRRVSPHNAGPLPHPPPAPCAAPSRYRAAELSPLL